MTQQTQSTIPAESDWLCESCGYVLNGLPTGGNCPECGSPTHESVRELRILPQWEKPSARRGIGLFLSTTAQLILKPKNFYRSLATRANRQYSFYFAVIHWTIASILLATIEWIHAEGFPMVARSLKFGNQLPVSTIIPMSLIAFALIWATTEIAARLTSVEASYRGFRLPTKVVIRGLDYHAAHLLPVAAVALLTVITHNIVLHLFKQAAAWEEQYVYFLCGEVVLAAGYLFTTYWTAMRNMMYASS